MLRRWTIRTRILVGIVAPLVALVALIASGVGRSFGSLLIAALIVTLAVAVGFSIARSIARPLTVLAAQAADVNALQRAGRADTGDELLPPVDIERGYGGEIGQLAGAIATGRQRALTILTDQRREFHTLREMAAHSAGRTNEVLAAALDQLDQLARRDHDPTTASALSSVQRMVARGDRHSAGVLALLGHDAPAATTDRSIADVLWAACLAVDAAERVELVSMTDAYIAASAVNDLAHLLAEILENAAQASGRGSAVTVLGESVDFGYLVTIVDRGDGLDASELAEANRRAGRAVPVEQVPGRALGLDIVGRLARRHGMLVRLGEAAEGGIVVRVEVPAMMLAPIPESAHAEVLVADDQPSADPIVEPPIDLVEAESQDEPVAPEPVEPEPVEPEPVELLTAEPAGPAAVPEPVTAVDEPIVVAISDPGAPAITEPVGLSVPSIVIESMPYVVRVQRPHDELLPSGQRKKRWAAALAKVGADN